MYVPVHTQPTIRTQQNVKFIFSWEKKPNLKLGFNWVTDQSKISFHWVPAQFKICFKIRNLFSVGKMPNLKPRFKWVKRPT